MDTLTAMEQVGVDNKDRPVFDIVIELAQVFVDPFAEAEEEVGLLQYYTQFLCDSVICPFTDLMLTFTTSTLKIKEPLNKL